MYSYELLEPGCYYLIQEKEAAALTMIKVTMASDHCMYVSIYGDGLSLVWKRKTDVIFDIIELLSDTAVKQWEAIYNSSEDALNYEEGEE